MRKIALWMICALSVASWADTAQMYQKKCANCHGANAKLSALGKSKAIAGMPKAALVRDIKGYKRGILNKQGMGGLMKAQVKHLSGREISALSAYISGLK